MPDPTDVNPSRRTFLKGAAGVAAGTIFAELAGLGVDMSALAAKAGDVPIKRGKGPDPIQAAWLYAQMARWRQAPLSDDMRMAAQAVFGTDLYDAAIGAAPCSSQPIDGVGAFVGPLFDAADVAAYVASWRGKNERAIPVRVVR